MFNNNGDHLSETGVLKNGPNDGDEFGVPFENRELADLFDRYSIALDAGDHDAAEEVLAAYPEIGEEFKVPLRGLYLLGCEARQQKVNSDFHETTETRRLGDFEMGAELGRGGMGIVYAARQISLQRDVALKILPFTAVLDPRQVSRFQNEAQAAASMHHPNIVPVYGVGCERGVHYYSMQLIKGQTMAQLIKQLRETRENHKPNKPTTKTENLSTLSTVASIESRGYVRSVIKAGVKIAEAIHFAHEHGIVHRDIKPSNLLIDQSGTPWVADFGLARGRGVSNLTSAGDQLGTLRYMSPEQAAGRNHQVDFRTDVYSLGVTLYELLTLQPAFAGHDRMKLLSAIQSEQPRPMRLVNASIPFDLETIINKATEKNPSQRYESAAEFAADLNRFLEGRAIRAKRKSTSERIFDSIARNKRVAVLVASALLMATIAATVVASVFYQQRHREQVAAQEARFYLQQAHKAVDRFGSTISDQLIEVPEAAELRAELIRESIGYYNDFIEYASGHGRLQFERGQAHVHLAGLHERVGDDVNAELHYVYGTETFAMLSRHEAKLEQAICTSRLGVLQHRIGDLKRASLTHESAITQFDALRDTQTASGPRAMAIANAALCDQARGNIVLAQKRFELAMTAMPESVNDAAAQSIRKKITNSFAGLLSETDPDQAIKFLRNAIASIADVNETMRRKHRPPALIRENEAHLADMQNNLAILSLQTNEPDVAKDLAQQAIDFWKDDHRRHPDKLSSIERLATAYNTLGQIRWQLKSADAGDDAFSKAESLFRKALEKSTSRPETPSRLAGVLHNRSLIAFQMGDANLASKRISQAIELQAKAIDSAPGNKGFQRLLKSHQDVALAFSSSAKAVAARSEDVQ